MRRLLALVILLSACGGGYIDTIDRGPTRPEPGAPPDGAPVRTITVEETTFTLYAEDNCVAVETVTPGLMTDVARYCPSQDYPVTATTSCAWSDAEVDAERFGCDAQIPTVLFGRVTSPNIGWVCIATRPPESLTTSVRFLDFGDDGYILTEQHENEVRDAHLFAPNGARFGTPPLDAPSIDIYEGCEAAAPWGDTTPMNYEAMITLTVDRSLANDDLTITIDAGLGEQWVSGNANDGDPIDLLEMVGAGSSGIMIRILDPESNEILSHLYEWPDRIRAIVASGAACREPMKIQLTIGSAALVGDATAIGMSVDDNFCSMSQ